MGNGRTAIQAAVVAMASLAAAGSPAELWYRAEAGDWVEALPVGNGTLEEGGVRK